MADPKIDRWCVNMVQRCKQVQTTNSKALRRTTVLPKHDSCYVLAHIEKSNDTFATASSSLCRLIT